MAQIDYTRPAFQAFFAAKEMRFRAQQQAALERYREEQLRIQQDMLAIRHATAKRLERAEQRQSIIDAFRAINEEAEIIERHRKALWELTPLSEGELGYIEETSGLTLSPGTTRKEFLEGPIGEVYKEAAQTRRSFQTAGERPRILTAKEITDQYADLEAKEQQLMAQMEEVQRATPMERRFESMPTVVQLMATLDRVQAAKWRLRKEPNFSLSPAPREEPRVVADPEAIGNAANAWLNQRAQ